MGRHQRGRHQLRELSCRASHGGGGPPRTGPLHHLHRAQRVPGNADVRAAPRYARVSARSRRARFAAQALQSPLRRHLSEQGGARDGGRRRAGQLRRAGGLSSGRRHARCGPRAFPDQPRAHGPHRARVGRQDHLRHARFQHPGLLSLQGRTECRAGSGTRAADRLAQTVRRGASGPSGTRARRGSGQAGARDRSPGCRAPVSEGKGPAVPGEDRGSTPCLRRRTG